jgi:hypothetical protein
LENPILALGRFPTAWPSLASATTWLTQPRWANQSGLVAYLMHRASPPMVPGRDALGTHGHVWPQWCTHGTSPWCGRRQASAGLGRCTSSQSGSCRHRALGGQGLGDRITTERWGDERGTRSSTAALGMVRRCSGHLLAELLDMLTWREDDWCELLLTGSNGEK